MKKAKDLFYGCLIPAVFGLFLAMIVCISW